MVEVEEIWGIWCHQNAVQNRRFAGEVSHQEPQLVSLCHIRLFKLLVTPLASKPP